MTSKQSSSESNPCSNSAGPCAAPGASPGASPGGGVSPAAPAAPFDVRFCSPPRAPEPFDVRFCSPPRAPAPFDVRFCSPPRAPAPLDVRFCTPPRAARCCAAASRPIWASTAAMAFCMRVMRAVGCLNSALRKFKILWSQNRELSSRRANKSESKPAKPAVNPN